VSQRMSEVCPHKFDRRLPAAGRRGGLCGGFLVGVVMLTLLRAGEALAADQASAPGAAKPEPSDLRDSAPLSSSLFTVPNSNSVAGVPEPKAFSTKDFRPRGHSILDSEFHLNLADDTLMHDTSVWQQLSEYQIHNRVRVLTLFESRASELSLQAGKRGAPSLQWTSRLSNWRVGSRGLLDRLFPVSAIGESNGSHGVPHSASTPSAGKAAVGPVHFGPPMPP